MTFFVGVVAGAAVTGVLSFVTICYVAKKAYRLGITDSFGMTVDELHKWIHKRR